MASTDFTDNVTVIPASWLDDVDVATYSYLSGVAGTNTIAGTGPVGLSAYSAGQRFRFLPAASNSSAASLAVTGVSTLGSKDIYMGGTSMTGGEIRSGIPADVVYDGTRFHLMGPFSGGRVPGNVLFAGTSTFSGPTSITGALTAGTATFTAATSFTTVITAGTATFTGAVVGSSSFKSSSATAGVGYATGAGGTQTQGTSKSTTVVLNTVTGEVTMHNAELAADTTVSFTLTNSAVATGDHMLVQHVSGGTVGSYTTTAVAGSGSATVYVRNITGSPLSEAIVLKFSVLKAVTA